MGFIKQGKTPCLILAISMVIIMNLGVVLSQNSINNMNVIDRCWRRNARWRSNRHELAKCSVGYAGKMTNNMGRDVINYKVIDPSDNPLNPTPGTLRYATTSIKGKVWITFQRDMTIKLGKPLLISSFTTIDGRGVNVDIANGGCILLQRVTNVIIHGLRIHDCKAQGPGPVMGPGRKLVQLGPVDGDAIRMVTSSKIWIDHNTLYNCQDGLIDVTRGSTDITISNSWFRFQDKVMLLGHDDGFVRDKNMKVTVVFNHFGPQCQQRMPRLRFGYAHVVNNLYMGWGIYAIGGTMGPNIKSQANLFVASEGGNKEIIWGGNQAGKVNLRSVQDVFENGASFGKSLNEGSTRRPNYMPDQIFEVADGKTVRSLTSNAGVLKCSRTSTC